MGCTESSDRQPATTTYHHQQPYDEPVEYEEEEEGEEVVSLEPEPEEPEEEEEEEEEDPAQICRVFHEFITENFTKARGAKFRYTNGDLKFREGFRNDLKEYGHERQVLELEEGTQMLFADITTDQWNQLFPGYAEAQKHWVSEGDPDQISEEWSIWSGPITTYEGLLPLSLKYGDADYKLDINPDAYSAVDYIGTFDSQAAWDLNGPWWYILEVLHDRDFQYHVAVLEEVKNDEDELVQYNLYGLNLRNP